MVIEENQIFNRPHNPILQAKNNLILLDQQTINIFSKTPFTINVDYCRCILHLTYASYLDDSFFPRQQTQ